MVDANSGLLDSDGVPRVGQVTELVLLSATRAYAGSTATGGRGGHPPPPGIQSGILRVQAHPCAAPASGARMQSQDGLAGHAPPGLAVDQPPARPAVRAAARGQGARAGIEPAVGLGHHGHPGMGWTEGKAGGHDRLRGPDGAGLALCQTYHRRGPRRDAAGGRVPAVRGGASEGAGDRVPQRQWSGVHVPSLPAVRASNGAGPLSHPPAEPGIQRSGGGFFRQLQARLRLSGVPGDYGGRRAPGARMDRALQPAGAAQRPRNAGASRLLRGMGGQK